MNSRSDVLSRACGGLLKITGRGGADSGDEGDVSRFFCP